MFLMIESLTFSKIDFIPTEWLFVEFLMNSSELYLFLKY